MAHNAKQRAERLSNILYLSIYLSIYLSTSATDELSWSETSLAGDRKQNKTVPASFATLSFGDTLKNCDFKMRGDIFYEVKYLIHCIMSRGIGIEFCSVLKNWDFKITGDIFHEIKYSIHCIMSRGIGIELCWVPSPCGLHWNEISNKLAK